MRTFSSLFGRRMAWLGVLLAIVLLWTIGANGASAEPVHPGAAMGCGGKDLMAQLATEDEAAAARIREVAAKTPNGKAIFWRISSPDAKPSHLFGTIHLSDARVTHLSADVTSALDQADVLALEVADLSAQALMRTLVHFRSQMFFADGRTLDQLLTPAEMEQAEAVAARRGLPSTALNMARPWFVSLLLAVSQCEQNRTREGALPLDLTIAGRARARGTAVVGLESMDDQLKVFASQPDADQLAYLRANLKFESQRADAVETLVQRYIGRELAMAWPLQQELWTRAGLKPSAMESMKSSLLTSRNQKMRDAALPLLEKGNAFIAVGALHLIGKTGLVALFRQAGYQVDAIE
ncbi:MAG: TraB/GumN family protein [Hyphomicrobiaceae bacterium]